MSDDRRAVKETYDRIAGHFSKTREYPWPEVEEFLDDCEEATVGLDVGCGNGRHSEAMADVCDHVVALDVSRPVLEEARERTAGLASTVSILQGDAAALALNAKTVDLGVYVATLHHLPDEAARRRSLDELARVLTPGGNALVSVWSTEHDRFDADSGFDTTVNWTLPDGETVPRYYHIYDPAEFREQLYQSDLAVQSIRVSSGNCYARVTVEK